MSKSGHPQINCEKPAYDVACAFGGIRRLSDVAEVDASTVSRWCAAVEKGGTGGSIPQRYWPKILQAAKNYNVKIDVHSLSGIPNA